MAKQKRSKESIREELWSTFIQEVEELVEKLEHDLLTIENDLSNPDLIAALFRTMHTVKGVCGMMGLSNIQLLAHTAEDVMDKVREGSIQMSVELLDTLFESSDAFKVGIELIIKEKSDENMVVDDALLNSLKSFLNPASTVESVCTGATSDTSLDEEDTTDQDESIWQQLSAECLEQLNAAEASCLQLEVKTDDDAEIDRLFRILHTLKGNFNLAGFKEYTHVLHLAEDLFGLVRDKKTQLNPKITDLLLEAIDLVRSHLEKSSAEKVDLVTEQAQLLNDRLISLIQTIDASYMDQYNNGDHQVHTTASGDIQLDKDYFDVFFELVWDNLKLVKSTLEGKSDLPSKDEVHKVIEAVEDIQFAGSQMGLKVVDNTLNEFMDVISGPQVTLKQILECSHEMWQFFWDLEEKIPELIKLSNQVPESQESQVLPVDSSAESCPAVSNIGEATDTEELAAEDFFSSLWPLLKSFRKGAESYKGLDSEKDILKNYINDIADLVDGITEIDAHKVIDSLKAYSERNAAEWESQQLITMIQDLYYYFWDLEDQFNTKELHKLKKKLPAASSSSPAQQSTEDSASASSVPIALDTSEQQGEEGIISIIDECSHAYDVEAGSQNEGIMEGQDPLFIIDFIEKAQQDMASYQVLKGAWEEGDSTAIQTLKECLSALLDSASRLGHTRLADVIHSFLSYNEDSNWRYDALFSQKFELKVFEQLFRFESLLPVHLMERHEKRLQASNIFKQWHARNCFLVLNDSYGLLQWIQKSVFGEVAAELTEEQQDKFRHLHANLESLIFTSQYYALPESERALLFIDDLLSRFKYDRSIVEVGIISKIEALLRVFAQTINTFNEAEILDESELKDAYQALTRSVGHDFDEDNVKVARELFDNLRLPSCLVTNLTSKVLDEVGKYVRSDKYLYLLFLDIEVEGSPADAAFELLESDLLLPIYSVTDYIDSRSVFYFLVVVEPEATGFDQKIEEIDPSRKYLRVNRLFPELKGSEKEAFSISQSVTIGKDEGNDDYLSGLALLRSTVGEIISVKSNLIQMIESVQSIETFKYVDKEMHKHEGDWLSAKSAIRQQLQDHDDEIKGLLQAQEDVNSVLDKLQMNFKDINEVPLKNMFNEVDRWFESTSKHFDRDLQLTLEPRNLVVERYSCELFLSCLKQLLYLFLVEGSHNNTEGQEVPRLVIRASETDAGKVIRVSSDVVLDQDGLGLELGDAEVSSLDVVEWLSSEKAVNLGKRNGFDGVNLVDLRDRLKQQSILLEAEGDAKACSGFKISILSNSQVLDGIVGVSNSGYYVFPLQAVQRIVQLEEGHNVKASADGYKNELLEIEGRVIPLLQLEKEQKICYESRQIVLILCSNDEWRGVLLDELIGLQQVLVTPLMGELQNSKYLRGCAVLARDKIGMVVDTGTIFNRLKKTA